MLPSTNIQSIVGATLYGNDDVKIGKVDQVLVDAADGHPTWAVLHGGVLGRKSFYVPLDDATWEHDDVFVHFDKDDVKNAPHPEADEGLSPEDEAELRAHYAGRPTGSTIPASAPEAGEERGESAPRHAASTDATALGDPIDGARRDPAGDGNPGTIRI